ncbi:MAG: hypothetical protein ACJ8CN_14590, partial [Gemmatimonadales bacterium]
MTQDKEWILVSANPFHAIIIVLLTAYRLPLTVFHRLPVTAHRVSRLPLTVFHRSLGFTAHRVSR